MQVDYISLQLIVKQRVYTHHAGNQIGMQPGDIPGKCNYNSFKKLQQSALHSFIHGLC